MKVWWFWFPEEEVIDYKRSYVCKGTDTPRDVAEYVCKYHYEEFKNYEVKDQERFLIRLIDPDGKEYTFTGVHLIQFTHEVEEGEDL